MVVDEACVDFGGERHRPGRSLPEPAGHPDAVKSRSLAGLRVGLAVGHADLVEALERIKNSFTYPLDRLAIAGAAAAFEDDAYFRRTCQAVIDSREALSALCRRWASRYYRRPPTSSSPVIRGTMPGRLPRPLREQGVIVRHFKQARIDQFLRITIGSPEQNQALLDALHFL